MIYCILYDGTRFTCQPDVVCDSDAALLVVGSHGHHARTLGPVTDPPPVTFVPWCDITAVVVQVKTVLHILPQTWTLNPRLNGNTWLDTATKCKKS